MDDTIEIDRHDLESVAARFPAHRRSHEDPHPSSDVSYLSARPATDHTHHVWDECGAL